MRFFGFLETRFQGLWGGGGVGLLSWVLECRVLDVAAPVLLN